MNLFWLLFIFSIIFFPSVIVHGKLIVHTVKERGINSLYRSLFYRLFVIQGVLEIGLLIFYILGRLLIREGLAGNDFIMSLNGDILPKLYHYGTIYFYFYVQVWGVIVQSLGRFAIVCAPNSRSTQLLESLPDVVWVLTNTLLPLAILSPQLLGDRIVFKIHETDGDAEMQIPKSVSRSDTLQCAISTCIASVICAACTALVLRKMMQSKKQLYSKGKQHRQVVQLTAVGLVNLLAQCNMTACHLIVVCNVQNRHFKFLFRHLYVIPAMLLTFVNPWMLVITDKHLRKRLIKC